MSLGTPHACDVNLSLQQRMNDEMDTCAFTAQRLGAGDFQSSRAPVQQQQQPPPPVADRPQSQPSQPYAQRREQDVDAAGFPPTWAIVLALAIALAAVAYSNRGH